MTMASDNDAASAAPAYTIATLVNDRTQYAAMCASFRAHGFGTPDCEFIAAFDPACAYRGIDELIGRARGNRIILCHQDVRLIGQGRAELDARLADLEAQAPEWALAGNAGGLAPGHLAIRITDPHGADRHVGHLPARVMSLDENFIVLRRQARIGPSRDLSGFHLYGADLCLAADVLGYSAWVVDFHLEHLSPGRKDHTFHAAEAQFRAKWSRALRPRWLQTTCTLLRLDGSATGRSLGPVMEPVYRRLTRRLAARGTWTRPAATPRQPS